ncbi:U6 snRNA (guanine-N(2))-methyltransferase THUMPD2 isoform X1 [Lampetra fluviatilis]
MFGVEETMTSEASSPCRLGSFMCTVGRGLEALAAAEIEQRLGATQVETSDGKVFFMAKGDEKLLELKSVERLFVLVKKIPSVTLPRNKGAGLRMISKRVTSDLASWGDAVTLWKGLQAVQRGPPGDRVSHRKRRAQGETASCCKKERTSPMLDPQVVPTRMEPVPEREAKEFDLENAEQDTDRCDARRPVEIGGESAFEAQPGSSEMMRHRICAPTDVESFRVSFRCSGNNSQHYNSQDLGKAVGKALANAYGWNTDLRHPQLEVFVHLNDLYCVVAFPVTRIPLSKRGYCIRSGLRSTVAYAMASLAGIQPHAVVMDPMCGMGTLLLEAAMAWKTVRCLGTDVDAQQLAQAQENIHFAELDHRVGLLQASVTALPIPCNAIDVIICDIPFGQKYSSDEEMKTLMPKILQEMMRVLRVGGNIVLLVSCQMSSRVRSLSQELHKLCDKNTESSVESAAATAKTMVFQDTSDPQATSNEDGQRCVQARTESCVESEEVTCGDSRLTCEGVYPVSLGETDACIHRYKKTATPT